MPKVIFQNDCPHKIIIREGDEEKWSMEEGEIIKVHINSLSIYYFTHPETNFWVMEPTVGHLLLNHNYIRPEIKSPKPLYPTLNTPLLDSNITLDQEEKCCHLKMVACLVIMVVLLAAEFIYLYFTEFS